MEKSKLVSLNSSDKPAVDEKRPKVEVHGKSLLDPVCYLILTGIPDTIQ